MCRLYIGVKLPSKRQHRAGHDEPEATEEERKTDEVSPVCDGRGCPMAARKGQHGGLAENREGLQPERAGGVQLVERRANGVEPAYVDNLDQKLPATFTCPARPASPGARPARAEARPSSRLNSAIAAWASRSRRSALSAASSSLISIPFTCTPFVL